MMNDTYLISVIVPVYNTENYLPNCIESILNQTHSKLQILLVDDGSTDSSGAICDEYAMRDNRITVVHKSNEGVSKARNTALDLVKGDFVGFVDSDDEIHPEMYEILLDNLSSNNADISICDFNYVRSNLKEPEVNDQIILKFDQDEGMKNALVGKYFAGHLCNKLFKKDLFDTVRLNEQIYVYEDSLAFANCMLKTKLIVFDSRKLYYYYLRGSSATHVKLSPKQVSAHQACEQIIQLLKKNSKNDILPYAYASTVMCNLYLLGKMCKDRNSRKKYLSFIKDNISKYTTKESKKHLSKKDLIKIRLFKLTPKGYFFIWRALKGGK